VCLAKGEGESRRVEGVPFGWRRKKEVRACGGAQKSGTGVHRWEGVYDWGEGSQGLIKVEEENKGTHGLGGGDSYHQETFGVLYQLKRYMKIRVVSLILLEQSYFDIKIIVFILISF
jgi:hypothetical protein